jgi:hypothetical protein
MDISNTTPQDGRYRVTGTGGSGMAPHGHSFPFRAEEALHWEVIPSGAVIQHKPASKGPWKVYFFVDGRGVAAEASSDNDHVELIAHGEAFRTQVRKAPRVGAVKADRTANAV